MKKKNVSFMMKYGKGFCQILCILAFFILILCSDDVCRYAAKGISVWAFSVLPVLLPFIILARFWIYYKIPGLFFDVFRRLLPGKPSLSVSLPLLLLGLSSGFPVGAVFIKYTFENGLLSKESAEEMLPLCSFVSPMFLAGYIRPGFPFSKTLWRLFVLSLYLPLLLTFVWKTRKGRIRNCSKNITIKKLPDTENSSVREIWIASLEIILTIGIYMMLFTILIGLSLECIGNNLPVLTVLVSNLEITSGYPYLVAENAFSNVCKGGILAGSISFGGLCTMAQVYSIVTDTKLSMKPYFRSKTTTAAISFALFAALYTLCS